MEDQGKLPDIDVIETAPRGELHFNEYREQEREGLAREQGRSPRLWEGRSGGSRGWAGSGRQEGFWTVRLLGPGTFSHGDGKLRGEGRDRL